MTLDGSIRRNSSVTRGSPVPDGPQPRAARYAPASPVYHPDRPGEQIRYCLDHTKATREMGWVPKVPLEEGLRLTVRAHRGG